MEAFQKNIDALEQKLKLLFQKWNNTLDENLDLKERNKKLEEQLKAYSADQNEALTTKSDDKIKIDTIERALDQYIKKIDHCIELINIELDGK